MAKKKKQKTNVISALWVRVGDAGNYEGFASLSDAAEDVGESLAMMEMDVEEIHWHRDGTGLEIVPDFTRNNYISAYWGDKEANLVAGLTKKEQGQFNVAMKRGYTT
jgi:hypothetical protein